MVDSTSIEAVVGQRLALADESITLMAAVADPVRWTVLRHLADQGTTCVCKLQEQVPVAANLLSYHLKVLRESGLVTTARRGRWVDYTLATDAAERLGAALPTRVTGAGS
ncbi:MAG: metalloregulator ArsR/SmtB family transcription factor [Nocardioidaceae bacterium]